jgi:hypothetical protein
LALLHPGFRIQFSNNICQQTQLRDLAAHCKGVEHRPVAKEEVHLLLIEPTGTPNTGDVRTAAPRKTA